MSVDFKPTAESELDDVRALLLSTFQVQADAPFANADLLRWKYFDPGRNGGSPRSFIMKQANQAVAHLGISPVRLLLPGREVPGQCFMDWAGTRGLPGVGVVLMKRLMQTSEVGVVAGGDEPTRAVIPELGFAPYGSLEYFVRIIRPLKRYLERSFPSGSNWKDLARLARNAVWRVSPLLPAPEAWSVKPVSRFEAGAWYNWPTSTLTLTRRDPDVLNYWLRCPRGAFSGFELFFAGQRCGYFLLNKIAGQTRIVDLRVGAEEPQAWQAAFTLASRAAAEDPDTSEIFAVASNPLVKEAIRRNGFRKRHQAPLFIYDPGNLMADHRPLHWNPIDDDTAIV